MAVRLRVRVTGPLTRYGPGLWADLSAQGYTPLSSSNLLRVMAHLSRWMGEHSIRPNELGCERIEAFVRERRRVGYTQHVTQRSLEPVLHYLRDAGVLPLVEAPAVEETPLGRLLRRYEDYLAQERGLVSSTMPNYLRIARLFLTEHLGPDVRDLNRLSPSDMTNFILREARSFKVGYVKLKVTALRSLLRYLFVRGDLDHDLAHAVPAVAGGRLLGLPQALAPEQMRKLLRSCDRRTRVGRRDFAVLLLMVRLGLRAGEVTAMQLDDIHWAQGELVVRGKGGQEDRLPLPHDVGEAVATYLQRARPRKQSRTLFLLARAPYQGLGRGCVTAIVHRAGARAGLGRVGAHRLRHTAATRMLRHGASLSEIAQVLRHRHLNTTAIYAKVDHNALRMLARPWPGAAS